MFGMQTAESILKDRQDATRKNTLGIIASNKARDNSAAATSEKAAFDVASALTSFAIGKFGKGSEDAGNLEAVRGAQDDSAGMAQSAIDAADAPRVQNSSYAGAEAGGYGAGVRQEAMAQNEAYTQERIGMLPQDMQDAVHGESYREGITRDMLSNPNAMAEHAYKNKQYADAMKFTNVGLAQTQAKEKDRMSYIRAQVSSGLVTGEAAAKQYDEIMSMGQAPAEGAAINDTRASTNNANFKSPEELLGGAKNSPEEEGFLVKMSKDYAGTVEATDKQVANYAEKNNIKGVRSKQDLEAIRTKATDELNQDITKKRSDKTSYNSFKTWLQENL